MANYKIYPLNLGKLIRNNAETPIVAFYLTDGVNKVIVDTGGVPADGKKFMPYFQEPGQRIEEALANLGVDPAEINIVINTHFHWDHMSNNHLFVNARHYVQRAEYQYALAPIPTDEWSFDKSKLIGHQMEFAGRRRTDCRRPLRNVGRRTYPRLHVRDC